MTLFHKYESETVVIDSGLILYGSVNTYSNFKRSGKDCNKDINDAEFELGCIFKEIKRV